MLLSEGATPKVVADKAEKEIISAEREWNNLDAVAKAVEERVDSLQKEYDNAKKLLSHMQEEQETVKAQLAAGEVHSPVNGVIVARRGEQGGLVDQSLADMFQIAIDMSQLEVVADVPKGTVLQPGEPVVVHIAELPAESISGSVKTVENGRVAVEFTSPSADIKPGLTAQISIPAQVR
jgi:multidrug resistance efflux pump